MSDKILVAYASRTGTTAGVAEAIGKTLVENGAVVDVRPVQEVTDLTPYRAVVVGSAIQGAKWLPEAMRFVETHRAALWQKPFAAFLVCMTLGMPNKNYHAHVAEWLGPVRKLVPTVSEGLFAGKTMEAGNAPSFTGRVMLRISILLGFLSKGDHRDWDKIRAWAVELAPLLTV
ncbi:MAG: flavodoxin domain-containing protein [Anaerolineae bacterium]|nr:flavodoxin domain-containing protein [Anaerolineae bacterium]